jgi:hypothetical protein
VITLGEALLSILQYELLLLNAHAQDKRWSFVSMPLYDHNSSVPFLLQTYLIAMYSFTSLLLYLLRTEPLTLVLDLE